MERSLTEGSKMAEDDGNFSWRPSEAPLNLNLTAQGDDRWTHLDGSVNAVLSGFVATAILVSMFLAMAVFERFVRPTSPSDGSGDLESQLDFNVKLAYPSPKMTVYARGVSVLMPGDDMPAFIAHPAPAPCQPDPISPRQQQNSSSSSVRENDN